MIRPGINRVFTGLLAIVFLAASSCATTDVPPPTTTAVWTPCPTEVPTRPSFPADALTGKEDIFTIGKTLYADVKSRMAYELDLRTRLEGCVGPVRPAP